MNWIMENSVTLIHKLKFCFIWKYKKLYRILQVFEFLKVYIKANCSPEVKIVLKKRKKTKMKIIFSGLALLTCALSLTPRDFAAYDEKLRAYQNMTGIDDFTFNEIWESGITNRKT